MKEKNKLEIREYKNKKNNRKIRFVYVKDEGKKGRKYKYKQGSKLYDYLEKYRKNYGKNVKDNPERYIKKIEKRKGFENLFKKGWNWGKIDDTSKMNRYNITEAYKTTIKPLVMDKELLNLISLPENLDKISHRFQHTLTFYNDVGEKLGQITSFSGKKIDEIIKDQKEMIYFGAEVGIDYNKNNLLQEAKKRGYEVKIEKEGTIANSTLTIIFRRGI